MGVGGGAGVGTVAVRGDAVQWLQGRREATKVPVDAK